MKYCYHASLTSGLKVLKPQASTHKQRWVYATKNLATAAMFLGKFSDFVVQTGIGNDDKPYIYERFTGALEKAYGRVTGSIYVLDRKNFVDGKTSFSGEIVSTKQETVVRESTINDALAYLYELARQGEIKIYYFPDQPENTPLDKSDLIAKAVKWTRDFGDATLQEVKTYHPDILEEVLKKLKPTN